MHGMRPIRNQTAPGRVITEKADEGGGREEGRDEIADIGGRKKGAWEDEGRRMDVLPLKLSRAHVRASHLYFPASLSRSLLSPLPLYLYTYPASTASRVVGKPRNTNTKPKQSSKPVVTDVVWGWALIWGLRKGGWEGR